MAQAARKLFLHPILLLLLMGAAHAQSATYYLHRENSTINTTNMQLRTTAADAAATTLQTIELKSLATGEYVIKTFETQANVPNTAGLIPAGSTFSFRLWMDKTAAFGVLYPKVKVYVNNTSGALACTGTSPYQVSTTRTLTPFSCSVPADITMAASDRFYLWVGVEMTTGVGANRTKAELSFETGYDSLINVTLPTPRPNIVSLSPNTGSAGTAVTVTGTNFGATQGLSTLTFNGLATVPTSWGDTSIVVPVPAGAATGPVVVTVRNLASNGVTFTVASGGVAGTVTRAGDGAAVGGALVEALQAGVVRASTTTAAGGTYALTNLAPGAYDLRVTASGYAPESLTGVAIVAGANTVANFVLSLPGSISGRVTQADGTTAIPGAVVKLYQGATTMAKVTTDVSGNYNAGGLRAGTYAAQAAASGYETGINAGVTVAAGATTTVDFNLTAAAGNNPIKYVYDELGRLVAVIDPAGDTARYVYDPVGNLLAITRQSSALVSILEFTPNAGLAGTTVTISGTGFSANASQNAVEFNGTAAAVLSATETQIVTSVPPGATTGPITVTTPAGAATSSTAFNVAATGPTIAGFTPTVGVAGTGVTITGTNFETTALDNRVKFNGTSAVVSAATATSISTSVPVGATSGRVSVTTPLGQSVSSTDFFVPPSSYAAADVEATGRMAIGESKPVTLSTANKIALIVFDGTAGQRVSLQMTSVTITGSSVYIYNPDGTQLTFTSSVNTGGGFLDTKLLPADGTYTIMVDPQSSYTGSMTLNLYGITDVGATITAGGPAVTVTTTTPGQNAQVSFTGTAGQHVSLNTGGVTVPGTTNISVKNPDGTTLTSMGINSSGGFVEIPYLPTTGTYTILVDPTGANTGSVTLTLFDATDITSTITPGGPAVTVTTSTLGQNAQVTFNGSANQRVSLLINGMSITGGNFNYVAFSIKKPDGTTLTSTTLDNSGGFIETQTLPAAGTYTIFVDPWDTGRGGVTLQLFDVPADVTGTITPGGPAVTVTTTTAGQNARLTFTGTVNQRVSLKITGVALTGGNRNWVNVAILKPDGTTLTSSTFDSSGGFLDVQTLQTAGTYTVLADPWDTSTGSVTLTLYNVPADVTGPITPGGAAVTVTTNTAGQNGRLTFSGTANQRVSLKVSGVTLTGGSRNWVNAAILKPDGTTLTSSTFDASGGFLDVQTLALAGTYTVLVDPWDTSTGSVTLTLYNVPADVTTTITPGGAAVTLTNTTPGQNGLATFTGSLNQRVSLRITNVSLTGGSRNWVNVAIKKPDGTNLVSSTYDASGGFIDVQTLPVAGTYTVLADPWDTSTGSVTLTLYNVPADAANTATVNGPTVGVTTTVPGQNAQVTFAGTAGQQATVRLTNNAMGTVTVRLFKPDGTQLTSTVSLSSSFNLATQTLPTTGTYKITIDPSGTGTGGISVSVTSP